MTPAQHRSRAVRRGVRGETRQPLGRIDVSDPGENSEAAAALPYLTRHLVDGTPQGRWTEESFADALAFASATPGSVSLSYVPLPDHDIIADLAEAWQLHPLIVEDLQHAGQRPKLERYGNVLFIVFRSSRYLDEEEEVEFSEFHVLVRSDALVVLCQDGRLIDGDPIPASLGAGQEQPFGRDLLILSDSRLMRLGSEAMVYRLLDAVVDGCVPVLDGLQTDMEQIERQVFSGDATVAERIYRLSQEVVDLLRANTALARVVDGLKQSAEGSENSDDLQAYLQDVADHLTRVVGEAAELRDSLARILDVNATLVGQRQNEDMKKISAWAGVLFVPTLIGGIYGMNFDEMPELHWTFGYPGAILLMAALTGGMYLIFKRKKWL